MKKLILTLACIALGGMALAQNAQLPQNITIKALDGTSVQTSAIQNDGKPMIIHDSFFDSDMDLEAYIGPHICVSRPRSNYSERVNMDRIMRAAGYVQGDDAIFQNPEILHIDYDEMNWAADNLIWVEGADKRLKEYYAKRKEFCHKRNIELNPGKDVPDWY